MPGILGTNTNDPIVVAYTCSEKKVKFFREIRKAADNIKGLRFVHVDELKGETYHALLHKRTDDLVAALNGCEVAANRLRNLRSLLLDHVVAVDNMSGVHTLIDRPSMARSIEKALERTPALAGRFRNLQWDLVPLDSRAPAKLAKFQYPVIMKRRLACGSAESHHMAVCHNLDQAITTAFEMGSPSDEINSAVFVQEYVRNHGGILFKLYSIGERVEIQARRSLSSEEAESTFFDSSVLSKTGVALEADRVDAAGVKSLPRELARKVADMVRQELDLSLFGVDVIFDVENGQYCICDVNYFPGYKGVKDANTSILQLAMEKVRERRRLLNGARIRSAPTWSRGGANGTMGQQQCAAASSAYSVDKSHPNAY